MLPVWGAYIWRGLYMEGLIFGILQYLKSILNIYEYKSEQNFFFTEISLPIHTILRIHSNASILSQNVKQHSYSWTSLQQPPWEWKKLAIVKDGCCRQFLNKGQSADFLSTGTKKGGGCREVTIVERWWLAEVWLYFTFLKAFHHRENESAAHVLFIEDEFVVSFFLTWQSLESWAIANEILSLVFSCWGLS